MNTKTLITTGTKSGGLTIAKEAQRELTREEINVLYSLEGSKELASKWFSESSLREIVLYLGMTNVLNITSKRVILDRWPGAMIEFVGDLQRLDLTVTMYHRIYIALYKNYMIFLHCQVEKPSNDTEDLMKTRISKYASLFHLMANSLIIQSQY